MTEHGSIEELSAELEAALARELQATYRHLSWDLFRDALTLPTLAIVDVTSTLGRWVADTRTIELSRALVLGRPWTVVVEVLKHEMAHQYVHDYLGETEEGPHGKAFRDVCAKLGIDASASGEPAARTVEEERVLDRVTKLLALATSENRNEAEAAMAAAQRLLLKHNLDVRKQVHARGYACAHLGEPTGRVTEGARALARILADHFFVEAIWIPVYRPREGKRGSVLEICGTPSNLEIATYVHGFLHDTAERLFRAHKKAHGIKGDRERRTFVAGVYAGFASKLKRESQRQREEGLVWVKDGDLARYFRQRHPHVHTVRFGGGVRSEAYAHGHRAGETIVLHRGVGAGAVSRGRLLGR